MPTTYPVTLPAVPADPETTWRAEQVSKPAIEHPDEGRSTATSDYAIDASSTEEAELRVPAWIDHSYEDDLRGATATSRGELSPGRWRVSLQVLGEF